MGYLGCSNKNICYSKYFYRTTYGDFYRSCPVAKPTADVKNSFKELNIDLFDAKDNFKGI